MDALPSAGNPENCAGVLSKDTFIECSVITVASSKLKVNLDIYT